MVTPAAPLPYFNLGKLCLDFFVLGHDFACHVRLELRELVRERVVRQCDHLRGKDGSVVRAVNCHRRHRDALGHLHDRKQAVHTAHYARAHRHADHRQSRVGRQHAAPDGPPCLPPQ